MTEERKICYYRWILHQFGRNSGCSFKSPNFYRYNLIKVGVNLPSLGVFGSELFTWNQTPQSFTRNFSFWPKTFQTNTQILKRKKRCVSNCFCLLWILHSSLNIIYNHIFLFFSIICLMRASFTPDNTTPFFFILANIQEQNILERLSHILLKEKQNKLNQFLFVHTYMIWINASRSLRSKRVCTEK